MPWETLEYVRANPPPPQPNWFTDGGISLAYEEWDADVDTD